MQLIRWQARRPHDGGCRVTRNNTHTQPHLMKTITLQFIPQKWVNDYAIDADPQGPLTWDVPIIEIITEFPDEFSWHNEHETRDSMRAHANAPQWVREWDGPFEVEFAEPFADPWDTVTHPTEDVNLAAPNQQVRGFILRPTP